MAGVLAAGWAGEGGGILSLGRGKRFALGAKAHISKARYGAPSFVAWGDVGHPPFEAGGLGGVFIVWGEEGGSRFARMPTHAMKLHEWGTRGSGVIGCMGHPPDHQPISC